MYGFQSVAQLPSDIRSQLHLVPRDVDLVVGIPRSGMIPAYLLGLFLNKLVVDFEVFLANGTAGYGSTRPVGVKVSDLLADGRVDADQALVRLGERLESTRSNMHTA
jgi:hypothetical protein